MRSTPFISCIAFLVSCAPVADPDLMAAPPVEKTVSASLSNAVCTRNVSAGGSNTAGNPPINDTTFRKAITQSLAHNGLLASSAENCRYVVDASFDSIFFAMATDRLGIASSGVTYSVFSKENGELIYHERLQSTDEASKDSAENASHGEGIETLYELLIRRNLTMFVTGLMEIQ